MKIFKKDGKVNFVDVNNVFVGFDNEQSSCECFGYAILGHIEENFSELYSYHHSEEELESYTFDVSFVTAVIDKEDEDENKEAVAVFKLVSDGKNDLFLHLYNSHSGWYSHGFEMKKEDTVIASGYL